MEDVDQIRVLLVDDHAFWRYGLRQIIDAESNMRVVGEAGDGEEAIRKANSLKPDVILMDVNMPRVNGVEATKSIATTLPDVRIVMVTVSDTDDNLFESLKGGAMGFLSKDISPEDLIGSINSTMRGEATLSPSIAARVVRYIREGAPIEPRTPTANLTEREDEILRLIARGARDREIAQQLFISESTVKKHVQNVLRKLHARNRVEAVGHLNHGASR